MFLFGLLGWGEGGFARNVGWKFKLVPAIPPQNGPSVKNPAPVKTCDDNGCNGPYNHNDDASYSSDDASYSYENLSSSGDSSSSGTSSTLEDIPESIALSNNGINYADDWSEPASEAVIEKLKKQCINKINDKLAASPVYRRRLDWKSATRWERGNLLQFRRPIAQVTLAYRRTRPGTSLYHGLHLGRHLIAEKDRSRPNKNQTFCSGEHSEDLLRLISMLQSLRIGILTFTDSNFCINFVNLNRVIHIDAFRSF